MSLLTGGGPGPVGLLGAAVTLTLGGALGRDRWLSRQVSAYDLVCRSVYDLTCRSRRGDHDTGVGVGVRVARSLSR
ncbi:MAG: hypothetical protein M3P93_01455 [Actinomycetota bacterium]|nr:hypothetical protein [Actinomycetota bacterium]